MEAEWIKDEDIEIEDFNIDNYGAHRPSKGCNGTLFNNDGHFWGLLNLGLAGFQTIKVWPNVKKSRPAHPDFHIRMDEKQIGGFWNSDPGELKGIIKMWPLGEVRIIAEKPPYSDLNGNYRGPAWWIYPFSG